MKPRPITAAVPAHASTPARQTRFPAPYQLDARRCIAYLTIEHDGPIPEEFRAAIGNRVFGCDDCLAVCPWNKFAAQSREAKLALKPELSAPSPCGAVANWMMRPSARCLPARR